MNLRTVRFACSVLLLAGCSSDGDDPPRFDVASWEAALLEHRSQKDEEFRTARDSPMAGTQYLKSEPADRVWLTREGRTFDLAYDEPAGANLELAKRDGVWHWSGRAFDVDCIVDDREVELGAALAVPAAFEAGGMHLRFYPSSDRVTFIVFDAERPEMTAFEHLLYYPTNPDLAVDARLVPIEEPDQLEVLTSRNLVKTFWRYAKIEFRVDGRDQELTAFKSALEGPGSEGLFVPFKDATSGGETYGAGRFLELDDPDGERFVLDFNLAFNPLCNYSPAYNCTVPPRENHLGVAILAGELTYPH